VRVSASSVRISERESIRKCVYKGERMHVWV